MSSICYKFVIRYSRIYDTHDIVFDDEENLPLSSFLDPYFLPGLDEMSSYFPTAAFALTRSYFLYPFNECC